MTKSQLSHLNNRLARDLGRSPTGLPLLKWAFSEDLTHPMRVPGFDMVDSPGGIAVAQPRYEVRKMNPFFDHQWVVCRWEAPIPEDEWLAVFGTQMVWPRAGEYYPTNVALPRGAEPNITWTERVIEAERERRGKTFRDHEAEIDQGLALQERRTRGRISDIVSDAMTAFGNVPGTRSGGVSFPSVP